MSSGLREVTRPWSVTTSWSTHSAPALRRSVCSEGQEVIRRPFTPPASISVQGPWQIAAIGFRCSTKCRMKAIAFGCSRSWSGLMTPPGSSSAS